MTSEEITMLFATAVATFRRSCISTLTTILDILYPLLLDIPYDKDGQHNLIGIIEPTPLYTATWGAKFPIPARPPAYPAIPDDASAIVHA